MVSAKRNEVRRGAPRELSGSDDVIILIVAMLINSISLIQKIHPAIILIIFIPLLIKSPQAKKYNYYQVDRESKMQCNRHLVEYIWKNDDHKPHAVFSNHLSLSMMLPDNYSDFNTEYEYKPGM